MNILEKTNRKDKAITGRMSDGSDRKEVELEVWELIIEDNGRKYRCSFPFDPTIEDIAIAPKEDITNEVEVLQTKIDLMQKALDDILLGGM